jgi:hypothetical protein
MMRMIDEGGGRALPALLCRCVAPNHPFDRFFLRAQRKQQHKIESD